MSNYRKKLIEVALPLDAVNRESTRENYIYRGNPSAVHKWWAQRPLATCRAVLFSSLVDDPASDPAFDAYQPEDRDHAVGERRSHLFNLIEELVKWENSNNVTIINAARAEIARSVASRKLELGELKKDQLLRGDITPWDLLVRGQVRTAAQVVGNKTHLTIHRTDLPPDAVNAFLAEHAPPVLDPFCGGGSIPLEAQRLGLRVYASDLNPVPVLITKALIEIPPKFADMPPVNPEARDKGTGEKGQKKLIEREWKGAEGLAEDVRYYGKWMRDEAEKRIGHLYPKVRISKEMAKERPDLVPYVNQDLSVIAWLWARTVPSPNPAIGSVPVPLVRTFWLSTRKGKAAWAEPIVDPSGRSYEFRVRVGDPPRDFDPKNGTVNRTGAKCLISKQPISFEYIRTQAKAGHMRTKLMAIVVLAGNSRLYISPTLEQERAAEIDLPDAIPDTPIPEMALGFRVQLYGMDRHWKLFTNRQLAALVAFSGLVQNADSRIAQDMPNSEATNDYAKAVATYLAFALDKTAEYLCTIVPWYTKEDRPKGLFARQAIPMLWDFAELNPLGSIGGTITRSIAVVADSVEPLGFDSNPGIVSQANATDSRAYIRSVVSTDPPYYDNIGYADLSDFFYAWLRLSIGRLYPSLFSTLLTPKSDELIATPYRHDGDRNKAERFFEERLGLAFTCIRRFQDTAYPTTVYYAFKQSESVQDLDDSDDPRWIDSSASTGWETMLEGLVGAGFEVTGTWPIRTERTGRSVGIGTNALASSIILVCRSRAAEAAITTRKDFVGALKKELPIALRNLQSGNIAPVDLAQAAIGPGMAVYSRYSKVINSDGSRMPVRTALQLINQALDEVLTELESEFDSETRWAIKWFEQHANDEGVFGDAETLSKAMAVSVRGLVESGFVKAGIGKVRLLRRDELDVAWNPAADKRLTVWEVTQHLIRRLEEGGDVGAAELLRKVGALGEVARDLAYRLYSTCERKKWAEEARSYNALVVAWPEVVRLSREQKPQPTSTQSELAFE